MAIKIKGLKINKMRMLRQYKPLHGQNGELLWYYKLGDYVTF
jgi:hypothetical protein